MRDRIAEIIRNARMSANPMGQVGFAEADALIAHGVVAQEWISVKDRLPNKYRDECGDLIPFLVCEAETEYPFRALFDGKTWGDGVFPINVTHWMPLPPAPKGE